MRCYECLGCKQPECPMYGKTDGSQCWEVDEMLCIHHVISEVRQHSPVWGKRRRASFGGAIITGQRTPNYSND